jgi:hypothetical protein
MGNLSQSAELLLMVLSPFSDLKMAFSAVLVNKLLVTIFNFISNPFNCYSNYLTVSPLGLRKILEIVLPYPLLIILRYTILDKPLSSNK